MSSGARTRGAARQALAELLEGRMDQLIDAHLEIATAHASLSARYAQPC
jgi:hypothetical protein